MVISLLIFLTAIVSTDACDTCKAACEGKKALDPCDYPSDTGTCCEMIKNEAGDMEKFCRECPKPGSIYKSECSIHSQKGYLGCFSNPKDAGVWQVCFGRKKGEGCMYETAASKRGGGTPAKNTSGYCITHYNHQEIMCLEAIGPEDHEECAGKGLGEPCTHSESANAICVHHGRRGTWYCASDKEESMVFRVCKNKNKGDECTFEGDGVHGQVSGLVKGECHEQEAFSGGHSVTSHSIVMCIDPKHIAKATTESPTASPTASTSVLVSPKALSAMMLLNYFM